MCLGGWWLDRHTPASSGYHAHGMVHQYDIGYATLVPEALDNVWVTGHCHVAEPAALAYSRVTVTCMGMDQAASTAAAAAAEHCASRQLDVASLQRRLLHDDPRVEACPGAAGGAAASEHRYLCLQKQGARVRGLPRRKEDT